MRRLVLSMTVAGMILGSAAARAEGGKAVGPFPISEGEDGTPLEVVFELLKAGVDADAEARKTYERYVLPGRKADRKDADALASREWENLTTQAHNYLVNDIDSLKAWVQEMNPGPAHVGKTTKKVYVTMRNQMDGMRQGMFIIERDAAGTWKLRTLNL
ncbi:MAG: hypothetical protein FJ098_04360 [Deltaproteobacteria bacterium]|nr:hypothetical protein [Deltaproteobacteria bacterium]